MRLLKLALLAAVASLLGSAPAFAMICGGGYSQTESTHTVFEHACYEYYFNNSGAALTSGSVVVIDRSGTGVNSSTETSAARAAVDVNGEDGDVDNIGTYITTTTTADNELVVGVVDDESCADQTYCRTQVYGPRLTLCAGSTDATTVDTAVGTSTVAGQCGDAANDADGTLGVALQATPTGADASDGAVTWIFIRPSWTD